MGAINPNQTMTARIVVSNHTDKDIKVLNITTTDSNLKTNINKGFIFKSDSHNSVEGVLKTDKEGVYESKIMIRTDSKENPLIEIDVRGVVGS